MARQIIYMDHNASTPCDPRVVDAMMPYFSDVFANPASRTHVPGQEAEHAVEQARESVARALGGRGSEVVFTSGTTEAVNLALRGVAEAAWRAGRREVKLVTQVTEHKAVLDTCLALERRGARIERLSVDTAGRVDPEAVARALDGDTVLVSLMAANNEVGTLQPLAEVGALCRERGVPLHVDAAQAFCRTALDVARDPVDLVSVSGHKIYGPKGVGALWIRRGGSRLVPQLVGGGHEGGLRSGTLNVPGIVGLARASELALLQRDEEEARLGALRERLWSGLQDRLSGIHLNGHPQDRLQGNLNVSFDGVEGEALLMALRRTVALSSGSACTSSTAEPSHVLRALGRSPDLALASLRFGLGHANDENQVDTVLDAVVESVHALRRVR